MAVGYRSSSAFPAPTDAQTSSRAVPVPAGAAAGDIALLVIELNAGNPILTWPSGFTEKVVAANLPDLSLKVAWKRLTAADTGSYTISWTGSQFNQGQCILLTGATSTGDPIEVYQVAQADFTTAVPSVAVTTTTSVFLVHFAALFNFRVSTPPAGYTRVQDANYLDTSYRIAGATGLQTASGGTAATATDHAVALLAVLPAAGGTATVNLSVCTESDIPYSLPLTKAPVLPPAQETDTATGLTGVKLKVLSVAAEASLSAPILATRGALVLGQSVESDSAFTQGAAKAAVLPATAEADMAHQLMSSGDAVAPLSPAAESDTGHSLSMVKQATLGVATETDSSSAAAAARLLGLAAAHEADTVFDLLGVKAVILRLADEIDTVHPMASDSPFTPPLHTTAVPRDLASTATARPPATATARPRASTATMRSPQ